MHISSTKPTGELAEIRDLYSRHTARKILLLGGLAVLLVAVALFSTATGAAAVRVEDVVRVMAAKVFPGVASAASGELAEIVVMELRLPRIFLAVLTGVSLAGAGAVMQGILRNPLVDPFTMGLSGGAAFGAALAIVLGRGVLGTAFIMGIGGRFLIIANAFILGLLTVFLVYSIARLKGADRETLILGGVAIGYLFSAGVSALRYVSNDEALRELTVWLMGGLWGAMWHTVWLLMPLVLVCMAVLWRYAWYLNVLSAGEEAAASLGVKVHQLRLISLAIASLAVSATVAFTGIIGFIGLVAPHICRILIGGDHRFLIPCSCLSGALLLLVSDTLARTVIAPTEIPVGIITSLIGAPFFIYLLLRRRRQLWS